MSYVHLLGATDVCSQNYEYHNLNVGVLYLSEKV